MADCCCFFVVNTSDVAVIESCGKYDRLAHAGLSCVACPCEIMVGKVSLQMQQLLVQCENKTLDNVFVIVSVSVQYQVIKEKVYHAFYSLTNPREQMTAYVHDVLRSAICSLTLDRTFEAKEEISAQIKSHLQEVMNGYGFVIHQTLMTDLQPDSKVKNAMNEINAAKRMKESANMKAEGDKVVKVKRAEAEAESMYLSGVGVARSRRAIMDGLKESIVEFSSNVQGTTAKEVMDLLVLTQYFDVLQNIGKNPACKTVFMHSDENPVRNGVLQAEDNR